MIRIEVQSAQRACHKYHHTYLGKVAIVFTDDAVTVVSRMTELKKNFRMFEFSVVSSFWC